MDPRRDPLPELPPQLAAVFASDADLRAISGRPLSPEAVWVPTPLGAALRAAGVPPLVPDRPEEN